MSGSNKEFGLAWTPVHLAPLVALLLTSNRHPTVFSAEVTGSPIGARDPRAERTRTER